MPNIQTPEAILSYPNLFTPRAGMNDGDDPQYSTAFVFEADTDITELKRTVLQVAREEWGDDLEGAQISSLETQHGPTYFLVADGGLRIRLPWRDQEEVIEDKGYPEGSTFINARSTNPPGVVSVIPDPSNDGKPAQIVNAKGDVRYQDGTVLSGAREVYAGARGRGLLSVYAYDVSGNKGVSFGLNGVQVTGDGERLDGRQNPADVFEADEDVAGDLSDLTDEEGEEPAAVGAGEDDDDLSDLIG